MTQKLIDKADVVAEINRVLNSYDPNEITSGRYALVSLRDFLDTLEVKEVDLEKEVDDYVNEYFSECDDGVLISDANSMELTLLDITPLAKHFFELGIKAKKGE